MTAEPGTAVPRLAHRPGLDAIRAIAVLMVVWHHTLTIFMPTRIDLPVGGSYGVDVFFVLSGFLITSQLLAERDTTGRISLSRFYGRRARRLLPAYAVLMAVYVLVALVGGNDRRIVIVTLLASATYTTNWVIAAGGFGSVAFDHLWSLAVEEQFYLVWPLAFGFLARHRALVGGLVAVIVAAAAWRAWLAWGSPNPYPSVYMRTDARVDELLVGALLAVPIRLGWRPSRRLSQLAGLAGLAGLAALFFAHPGLRFPFLVGFLLVSLCACGLILAALDVGSPLERVLRLRPLQTVGRCSYALYLWHPLVMVLVYPFDLGPNIVRFGVAWTLSWVAAWCSTTFIEQPFRVARSARLEVRSNRPRRSRPPRRAVLGVIGATLGLGVVAGGLASAADGPPAAAPTVIGAPAATTTPGAPLVVAPGAAAPGPTEVPAAGDGTATGAPLEGAGAVVATPVAPEGSDLAPGVARRLTALVIDPPDVQGAVLALRATLLDDRGAPVPGRTIRMRIGDSWCEAATDASGAASCSMALPAPAPPAAAVPGLTATFAGDDSYAPAAATLP